MFATDRRQTNEAINTLTY